MQSNILTFRTIIKKDGKYYHGLVPSLPGCHTQGITVEETRGNLREAITGCLGVMAENGQAIPKEEGLESVEVFDLAKLFPGRGNDFSFA